MESIFSAVYFVSTSLIFLLATLGFVPGVIKNYQKWNQTNNPIYAGIMVGCFIGSFYLYSAIFILFMKPFLKHLWE